MQVVKTILPKNIFISLAKHFFSLFILSINFIVCNTGNENITNSELKFYFNNDSIKINNSIYFRKLKVDDLKKEIGIYTKSFVGINDIYTWDRFGINAYCTNDTKEIKEIKFNFLTNDYDFSPKFIFSGTLLVGSIFITKETQIELLKNNGFDYPTKFKVFLRKEIDSFDIYAFLNNSNTKIEYISINIEN